MLLVGFETPHTHTHSLVRSDSVRLVSVGRVCELVTARARVCVSTPMRFARPKLYRDLVLVSACKSQPAGLDEARRRAASLCTS